MKTSALLVALSAASLASGIAFAQTYNQPTKPEATKPAMGATTTPTTPAAPATGGDMFSLSKFDRNGDGAVDREEARTSSNLSQIFDKADTNKDGKLDAAELNAATQMQKAKQ